MSQKTAVIIGAGPAGLTAAYELQQRTDIRPLVFEMTSEIGGISKTVNYKGNRIDIGGHRFFSKSDRVMQWWTDIMPVEAHDRHNKDIQIHYQGKERRLTTGEITQDPDSKDLIFLVRDRLSRIFYLP